MKSTSNVQFRKLGAGYCVILRSTGEDIGNVWKAGTTWAWSQGTGLVRGSATTRTAATTAMVAAFTAASKPATVAPVARRNPLLSAYRFFRTMGSAADIALRLARAETYADAHGWVTAWEHDDCGEDGLGDHGLWCPTARLYAHTKREGDRCEHEILCAVLKAPTGDILGSLGACIDVSRDYARLVSAELALEAMSEQRETRATAVKRRWNIIPLPLVLLLALILAPLVSACTLAPHETPPSIRTMPAQAIVTPAPRAYSPPRRPSLAQQRKARMDARRADLRRAYALSLLLN